MRLSTKARFPNPTVDIVAATNHVFGLQLRRSREIERVQTGIRIERRLLKVLKAFAELKDMTVGDLLEGILLHVFEGKTPFSEDSLRRISDFKKTYGCKLKASDSHRLKERQR